MKSKSKYFQSRKSISKCCLRNADILSRPQCVKPLHYACSQSIWNTKWTSSIPGMNQFWQWHQVGRMLAHHGDGMFSSYFNFILDDSIGLWVGIIWTVKLTLEMLTVHWQQIRCQLTMLLRNSPVLWNENVAIQGFESPAFGFMPGDLPLQPMRPDMPNLMFWLVFDFVFSHPASKFCAIALVIQP